MKSCRLFNFLGKMISKSIRKSLICSTFSASTGRFFSALCWGIQGCRFLAAKVWSRAFARKHQPAAPAAVWAARSPRLYYQEYRYVLTTVSKRSRVNSFITVENIYCAHWVYLNLNIFCIPDRGNDNWLLKYDCPMDTVGNRVRNTHTKA